MSARVRAEAARGFTLLEVVVALAILAISLTVLLEANASSLGNAGRARDLTIAALLARAKVVDVEQKLFDEGFTLGDQTDEGNFGDEGHEEITWKTRVMELELDLSMGGAGASEGEGDAEDDEEGGGLAGMLGGFAPMLEGLTKQLGDQMRLVEVTVTWPSGRYHESMTVREVVTRADLGGNAGDGQSQLQNQLNGLGGQGGGGGSEETERQGGVRPRGDGLLPPSMR